MEVELADELFDFLFTGNTQEAPRQIKTIEPNVSSGIDSSVEPPKDELFDYLFAEKPEAQEDIPQPIQEPIQDPEQQPIIPVQPVIGQEPIGITPQLQPEVASSTQVDIGTSQQPTTSDPNKIFGSEGEVPEEPTQRTVGTGEAMIRSLGAGAGELGISIARAPQTAAEIYIGLNNLFNKGMNKGIETATFGKVKDAIPMASHDAIPDIIKLKEDAWDTKAVRKFVNNQKEAVNLATNGKGIVDNLISGDFGEAGKSLAIQSAAQVPLVASMFVGGLAGLSAKALGNVAGATTASQQMDQYWQDVEKGITNQNPDMAAANALVNGFIEKFGESLGTGKIVTEAIELLGKAGKKAVAKKTIGNTVGSYIGKVMQASGREFTEEAVVGFSQTVSDKVFGAKPDATFLDAVKEGIEGGLTGFATSFGTTGQLAGIAEVSQGIQKEAPAPEGQIAPSEVVEDKPVEKLPDVTDEVLAPIEKTPEETQLSERIQKEQAEQVETKDETVPVIPKEEKIVPEEEKPIAEPAEIEPEKTVREKVNETLVEKGLLEKEKPVKKKVKEGVKKAPVVEKITEKAPIIEKEVEKPPQKKPVEEKKESKVAKVEGQEVDIAPTEAQKEAGNYKVAHVKRDGMEISIENPAGSVRSGTDKDGETWSQEMKLDYGYIKGTVSKDKDQIDLFIKPGAKEGGKVFVVNQVDPKTKKFDEVKGIIGLETEQQALEAYNSNYEKGWQGAGSIVEMTMDEFKTWARSDAPSKGEAKPIAKNVPVEEKLDVVAKIEPVTAEKPKAVPTTTIKINDGTRGIEIARGTKVKKGAKTGEIVGYRNVGGKYFSRFKDDKTGKVELVPLKTKLELVDKQKKEDIKTKKTYIPKEDANKEFIKDITEGIKYERKETDYTKSTKEEVNKARENFGKRANTYRHGISQEKQKIVEEREYVNFASNLRQDINETVKGIQFEHLKGVINKDNDGNLVTRNEQTEKQLQSIADAWNIAREEGRGSTASIVPPEAVLQSNSNWSPDDVVDILRDGLNKKELNSYNSNSSTKENKTDEDYENELDYLIQETEKIDSRLKKVDIKEEGYPSDWDIKPSEAIPDKAIDKAVEELGTKPNQLDITKPTKKPDIPKIQPSEAIPDKKPIAPTDQKSKTNEQQRVEDVIDTVKKSGAKSSAEKNKQAKAVSTLSKQIQHNPGGKKKGSGWLSPWENVYFHAKEIAWPIIKIRKILEKRGVKKEGLLESIDYAVDAVRGADAAAQQYIKDNYEPIFSPLKDFSLKDRGKVGRALSRYLVAKRTEWLYNNKANYEDAGISLETAQENISLIESGDHPNSDIILDMAQKVWVYNKELVKIKYENGVIDKDLLENLKEPYYVPHYRDVETGIHKPSVPMKLSFTSISTGIKRIKGSKSGHMIIDPLQLMISTTQETIVNAARAKVAQNIIAISEENPEVFDNLITQYTNPPRKAGSIEHRIQIDESLRDDINKIASKYGYNVKKVAKFKEKRLGQFDSFNQEIKILYGATENQNAHELGHALDLNAPWVSKVLSNDKFNDEMNNIADSRYEGEEVPQKFVRYVRQRDEKIAEFISLYLTNRPMLNRLAPGALSSFDSNLEKDSKLKGLKDIVPSNVKKLESFKEDNWVTDNSIPQDEDIISLRREGKLVHYRVPLEMALAIKTVHPKQLPEWLRWVLAVPTQALRFGAVGGNIGFAIPNLNKDQVDAAFNTKAIPFVDWFIGANHFLKQDEVYKMYNRMGGGMNSPESGIAGSKKGYAGIVYGSQGGQFLDPFYWKNRGVLKGTKDLSWYGLKMPFKPILAAIELSEAGSRLGVFHRNLKSYAKKHGIDLNNLKAKDAQYAMKHAVHAARHSTIDFNRFGYSGKTPNEIIPFVNAALEGVDRYARSWVVPIQEGRVPTRQIMFTGLTFMIYAGLVAWNERNEWYKKIPSREKSNNWIIMDNATDPEYKKMPKGHITKLILNPFQMIYEKIKGLSQTTGWGIAVDMFMDISPINQASIIPVSLKLILEPIADYDFYWQNTIEKPSQKTWPKGLRSRSSTSETLKSIGKALNISPDMMQHEVRVALGGLGRDILWLTDWVLGTAGVQKPPGLELENAVVVKRFIGKAEEWKSDAASRIRTISKRISEIKKGGKNARIIKMRRSGASRKDIYEAVKKSRIEMLKLQEKRKELEITIKKADSLKHKAQNRGIKLK